MPTRMPTALRKHALATRPGRSSAAVAAPFLALLCIAATARAMAGSAAVPANYVPVGKTPADVAWQVLKSGIGRVSPNAMSQLTLASVHDTGRGPIIVQYRRRVSGIDVYAEPVAVLMRRNLQPIAVVGSLGEPDAVPSANSQGFTLAKGRKVWFRQKSSLLPALVTYRSSAKKDSVEMFAEIRSWPDNQLLSSGRITDELENNYLVYTGDDPYGSWGPHPTGISDLTRPTLAVPQQLLRIDEMSVRRNDPWLTATGTATLGNNTDVYFNTLTTAAGPCLGSADDAGAAMSPGDFRAPLRSGAFSFAYDPARSSLDPFHTWSQDPCPAINPADAQLNAKVVQAFYTSNLLHDFFYDAGFDESSGNSQQDNFGRGGTAGDPIVVKVGSTATFINTPLDGDSAILYIGQFSRSTSHRDSTLDRSVFAHEWGHHMVRRLLGGGLVYPSTSQAQALNEGWADFIGVLMNTDAAHFAGAARGATSSYAVGSYTNTDYRRGPEVEGATAPSDAYFYGIRRWPYGPSNPLTFRHIGHNVPLPAGFSYFDWKQRARLNTEYHSAGEIWANTLWDCARSIFVDRVDRGFAANKSMIAEYLVAGMKLTPANPTYNEARDGFLLAMRAADTRDWTTCRAVFARRGMGSSSLSPQRDSTDHSGIVETFGNANLALNVVEAKLDDSLIPRDADGILDNGETGQLYVTIRNTGFEIIRGAALAPVASADYEISGTATATDLLPGGEATLIYRAKLSHARNYDNTLFSFAWSVTGDAGATASGSTNLRQRTHYDIGPWKGAENAEYAETFGQWTRVDLGDAGSSPTEVPDAAHWRRLALGANNVFAVGDRYSEYDVALVSPPILVGNEFEFHVSFGEASRLLRLTAGGAWVGKSTGFIEVSSDGGVTWVEIGRTTANSAGFPALVNRDINLGFRYALQTVRVRFRVTSRVPLVAGQLVPVDEAWYLDNIQFFGIFGEPLRRVYNEDFR